MATATAIRNGSTGMLAYSLNSRGIPVPQLDLQQARSQASSPRQTSTSNSSSPQPAVEKNPKPRSDAPKDETQVIQTTSPVPNGLLTSTSAAFDFPDGRIVLKEAKERFDIDGDLPPPELQITDSPLPGFDESQSPQVSDAPYTLEPRPSLSMPMPSMPKHPNLPSKIMTNPVPNSNGSYPYPRIQPSAASPSQKNASMMAPISPNSRAIAQQPIYITNAQHSPVPVNPEYPIPQPRVVEEVCAECAMRDEDMAGVDVTSPGVWDRESDADYRELIRIERQERETGQLAPDWSARPRSFGERLSENNIKVWLSMNPREPASRQQTLIKYVKNQYTLLEADALARARAQLDAQRMDSRGAYSRRSATDNTLSQSYDDMASSRRVASAGAIRSSRDAAYAENGLLLEPLDARREDKEERDRRRREDKAFKNPRSSVYSVSAVPANDTSLKTPSNRYSVAAGQPSREARSTLPRAHSQASFSDVQSIDRGSPKHRFFGFKNLSPGFRSRDSLVAPSVMSGSMMDMHLGLQRESQYPSPDELVFPNRATDRLSEEDDSPNAETGTPEKGGKKKKAGLAKIWKIVTGSKASDSKFTRGQAFSRTEDNLPLAPPPPLSYLVERSPAGNHHRVLSSTSSLPSQLNSPKYSIMANVHSGLLSPGPTLTGQLPSPHSRNVSGEARDLPTELRSDHWPSPQLQPEDQQWQSGASSPRAASFLQVPREKSLPPLPPPDSPVSMEQAERSRSLPLYNTQANGLPPGAGAPQQPSFNRFASTTIPFPNGANAQRQSVLGPNVPLLTTDSRSTTKSSQRLDPQEYNDFGPRASEFGVNSAIYDEHQPAAKRKSKFSFPSIFPNRKSTVLNLDRGIGPNDDIASSVRSSEVREDSSIASSFVMVNGRNGGAPRLSVLSRKGIGNSFDQEPQFGSSRYPQGGGDLSA